MASKSKIFSVYIHTNKINGKVYIGITSAEDPNARWRNGRGYSGSPHFYSAIKKYGWDNFEHVVLQTGLTEEEAKAAEIALIAEYNSTDQEHGYNMTLGGEGGYKGKNSRSVEYKREQQKRYRSEHPEVIEKRNARKREIRNKDPKYIEARRARYEKRRSDPEYLEKHRKAVRENNKRFIENHQGYRKARMVKFKETHPDYWKERARRQHT